MSLGNLTNVSRHLSDKESLKVVGDLYRDARLLQGKTIQEISGTTRIGARFLEALENDDIEKLPGGIFTRSFVRSYAEALGLDSNHVLDEYVKRFPEISREASGFAADSSDVDDTFLSEQRMARAAVILLALSIPLIALLVVVGLGSNDATSNSDVVEPISIEPVGTERLDEIVPTAVTAAVEPTRVAPRTAGVQSNAFAEAGIVSLDIHPTNDCWVSVTVDGGTAWSRVMRPGDREVFDVSTEATINVGDAAAFEYTLNGHVGRPLGEPGEVVTFTVTPDNLASYLSE